MIAVHKEWGKSEHHKAECWLITSQGDLKESATEIDRPNKVRMERRGKSSPFPRWLGKPCKPHLVQEKTTFSSLLVGKSLEYIGNNISRQMIIKYRTRLIDHLVKGLFLNKIGNNPLYVLYRNFFNNCHFNMY